MPIVLLLLLFLALAMHNLVSFGMHVDGVFYANIAPNLSEGIGQAWSVSRFPGDRFYDHPPGFFWLLSEFYQVFGDSRHVEKWFSFFCVAIQIPLIQWMGQLIKKHGSSSYPWLASLFFVITPLSFLMSTWNMLENVVVLFTMFTIAFLLKAFYAKSSRSCMFLTSLAAICTWGAILTKGVLGLYAISGFLGLYLLHTSNRLRSKYFFKIAAVYSFIVLMIFIFMAFYDPAKQLWLDYLQNQVFNSLSGRRELDNPHFQILWPLVLELAPMIVVTSFTCLFLKQLPRLTAEAKYWLFIAISATAPLTISPKNRVWFLALSIPFFALFCASLIQSIVPKKKSDIKLKNSKRFAIWQHIATSLLVFVAVFEAWRNWQSTAYYPNFHEDFSSSKWEKRSNDWILASTCPSDLVTKWSLKANFSRDYKVRLSDQKSLDYLVVDTTRDCKIPARYQLIHPMKPKRYAIYRSKSELDLEKARQF